MQIYLCMSVILAIVGKFNPNETVRVFVRGAKGMLAAALVLGLSRSISMILDEALVLDRFWMRRWFWTPLFTAALRF